MRPDLTRERRVPVRPIPPTSRFYRTRRAVAQALRWITRKIDPGRRGRYRSPVVEPKPVYVVPLGNQPSRWTMPTCPPE